jgi:hypothetical protein
MTTLLINPLLFLTSYYFQLVVQADMWRDPFVQDANLLDKDEKIDFIFAKMSDFSILVMFTVVHTYLI